MTVEQVIEEFYITFIRALKYLSQNVLKTSEKAFYYKLRVNCKVEKNYIWKIDSTSISFKAPNIRYNSVQGIGGIGILFCSSTYVPRPK